MKDYKLVLLANRADIDMTLHNIIYFKEYIKPKEIVVIGTDEIPKHIWESKDINFVLEDTIFSGLNFKNVKLKMNEILHGEKCEHGPGWFLQQFLKMAYSFLCEENEYLIWDGDTIPVSKVTMKDSITKKLYFDRKEEHYIPYFQTIQKLFPSIEECYENSFISEHMIIKKNLMIEMIQKIESNVELKGESFWEKILYTMGKDGLKQSGFSEYETYGNYVMKYHPEEYILRTWMSVRDAACYFNAKQMEQWQLKWISISYQAISFESYDCYERESWLFQISWIRFLPFRWVLRWARWKKRGRKLKCVTKMEE